MNVMSLLRRTKLLLRQHRVSPKKHLGQSFTVEPSIFERMARYASLSRNDVTLDIGAGLGFLTRFLADKCRCVLAVESDARLVRILHENLRDLSNVNVFEGDVLKVEMSQFNKVVSIPPYHISSSLLLWLFSKSFDRAVLIFQKEFANRLVASVRAEDYGWLTVVTYYHAEVELLDEVPKWMFYPQPKVGSIVVRLKPREPSPFNLKNTTLFKKLVQALFTQRNRKVRNAVLPFIKSKKIATMEETVELVHSLPFHDKRVRELAPEDFGVLANAFAN
jgi:16S rRNA (adenine1518-N6/adenine1519-N6)-dimethyltransferase